MRGKYFVITHHRTGPDQAIFVNNTIIHHTGLHANKAIIAQDTGMEQGLMADGYIMANDGAFAKCLAMNHRAVLYITIIANLYLVNITADNATIPYIALWPNNNITNYNGPGGNAGGAVNARAFAGIFANKRG